MAAQAPRPSLNEDKYVALVSGLGLGDDASDPLKLSLLVDYLVGSLASNEEQTRVSKVLHNSKEHVLCRICTCFLPCCFQVSRSTDAEILSICHNTLGVLAQNCLPARRFTLCHPPECASAQFGSPMQIVRVVVAGGLLKSTEGLLQATTHKQPRQQASALAPIRSGGHISV